MHNAIPSWKRNLPLIVLSSVLLLCSAMLAIALMNLPLPNSDPIVGTERRLVVLGIALMAFGFGALFLRVSFKKELDWTFALFGFAGIVGMVLGMGGSIYWYPLLVATS